MRSTYVYTPSHPIRLLYGFIFDRLSTSGELRKKFDDIFMQFGSIWGPVKTYCLIWDPNPLIIRVYMYIRNMEMMIFFLRKGKGN